MANLFPPKVTVNNTNVELGTQFKFMTAFSVEDLDQNSEVVRYRFRDNNSAQTSGYYVFKGQRMAANSWFTVEANELDQLFYHAGLIISSESVGAVAFDGEFWSQAAFGIMSSIAVNDKAPNVTVQSFSIQSTEPIRVANFISASDPNGDPIASYMLIDRLDNPNGGYFTVAGVRQASKTWFTVDADKLGTVRYFGGLFGQAERIGVKASDGRFTSALAEATATTLHNNHRPVVNAIDLQIPTLQSIGLGEMFTYSDQDGNSLKYVRIFDTGTNANSGGFYRNGTKLAAGQWHQINANQISQVTYKASGVASLENFRVQAFDGRKFSTIDFSEVVSVAKPDLIFDDVLSLNDFEFRQFIDLVSEAPGAQEAFRYEIIDLNDNSISADLVLNGSDLAAHQVHTIEGIAIENLRIRGGSSADTGRLFDDILFRSYNGVYSDWKRLNIDTTEIAEDSLLDLGRWLDRDLTFSFPNELPAQHVGGFAGNGFNPMTAGQRAAVREILKGLEDITQLTFTEVSGSVGGDLEYFNADLPAGVLGVGFPPSNLPGEVAGDFIISNNSPAAPIAGELFYTVMIHELGHTMGLKHVDNATGAGTPPLLPPSLQDLRYSVMTSVANPPVGTDGSVWPRTFQLFDMMALQRLYGTNPNYNSGNTHIRGEFQNDSRFHVIYDTGGYDTINRTIDTVDAVIDLNEGRFSSLGGQERNVSILYGTKIEAARGGSGNDTIIGNELNNLLIGNNGADTFQGKGGRDVIRGLAGNDTYRWGLGDGFDIINEGKAAGRDTLEIISYGGLDDFTEDIAFRKVGRNLVINFNVDLGLAQGGITIANQAWGGSRIERLRFLDLEGNEIVPTVDVTSIFTAAGTAGQRFRVTEFVGQFGNIAVPV